MNQAKHNTNAKNGLASGVINRAARTKINIATPSYGSSYSGVYVRSMYSLLTTAHQHNILFSFSEFDYSDIVTSRNYLISNFFFGKKDCTHILFIDDDMGFDHSLIYRMLNLNEDIVGVIAPKRSIDLKKLHAHGGLEFPRAYAKACEFIGTPSGSKKNEFSEVSKCGTGILLISRECIEKMILACPDIIDDKRYKKKPYGHNLSGFITPFNKIELDHCELSEDFSFCHRWTNLCNGKIYASTSSKIQHAAQIVVESMYSDSL